MKSLIFRLLSFIRDKRGNFTTMFALTLFPVAFTIGAAVDYSAIERERSRMQETADAAALYAVKQMQQAGYGETALKPVAGDSVAANFDIEGELELAVNKQEETVTVTLRKTYDPAFVQLFYKQDLDIEVSSEVSYSETLSGTAKCFMALANTGTAILSLNGNATVDASECDVQVNSNSNVAVDLNGNGTSITSHSNCFVGGVSSGLNRISPPPVDCQPMPDPFQDYRIPSFGACDETDLNITVNGEAVLDPGLDGMMVLCGGLSVGSQTELTFLPGLYIMKDGPFKTTGGAWLKGVGTTFAFVGDDVAVQFSGGTTFDLIAMDSGALAGFLFFFDKNADVSEESYFTGNSETYFEGIMAFGSRDVTVSGDAEVNSGSPLSVIAAHQIKLNGNGTLHFDVDEAATDLPVPEILYDKEIVMHISR